MTHVSAPLDPIVPHPFMLMTDPQAVFAAIERSERLARLQSRICRPLDKPLLGQPGAEAGAEEGADNSDADESGAKAQGGGEMASAEGQLDAATAEAGAMTAEAGAAAVQAGAAAGGAPVDATQKVAVA